MHQITPEQGDALTRASWPRPYADTMPAIDYSLHTAECSSADDYDTPVPGLAMTLAILAGLVVVAALVVIGLRHVIGAVVRNLQ